MHGYMDYSGDKKQQAGHDMEYRPIMPNFMVVSMSGHVQFYSDICGEDKHQDQNPIYYIDLFHLFPILCVKHP